MDVFKLLNLVITQKKDKCESNIFNWVRVVRYARTHPKFLRLFVVVFLVIRGMKCN